MSPVFDFKVDSGIGSVSKVSQLNNDTFLNPVDSQVHRRSVRSNYDQVSEMMDNINYLFYLGANCDGEFCPTFLSN